MIGVDFAHSTFPVADCCTAKASPYFIPQKLSEAFLT